MKRIVIKNKQGKIVSDSEFTPCYSFVLQFLECLYVLVNQGITHPWEYVTDTSGSKRVFPQGSGLTEGLVNIFSLMAASENDSYGIVVGTGTTSPATDDYSLETQIAHGTGAGELVHGAVNAIIPVASGVNIDQKFYRTFTNNSGGSITVKEIGMITRTMGSNTYYFLIARDSVDHTVLDGQTLTVEYLIRVTC